MIIYRNKATSIDEFKILSSHHSRFIQRIIVCAICGNNTAHRALRSKLRAYNRSKKIHYNLTLRFVQLGVHGKAPARAAGDYFSLALAALHSRHRGKLHNSFHIVFHIGVQRRHSPTAVEHYSSLAIHERGTLCIAVDAVDIAIESTSGC